MEEATTGQSSNNARHIFFHQLCTDLAAMIRNDVQHLLLITALTPSSNNCTYAAGVTIEELGTLLKQIEDHNRLSSRWSDFIPHSKKVGTLL